MLLVSMLVLVVRAPVLMMCDELGLALLEAPPLSRRLTSSSSVPVQHQPTDSQTDGLVPA